MLVWKNDLSKSGVQVVGAVDVYLDVKLGDDIFICRSESNRGARIQEILSICVNERANQVTEACQHGVKIVVTLRMR